MNLTLKGIITPLVIPLNSFEKLDMPGLKRLIEYLVSASVYTLFNYIEEYIIEIINMDY